MPINAGPDEDQQMIWAASAARLQFEPTGPPERQTMRAPTALFVERCFQWRPDITADCQDGATTDPAGDIRSRQTPFMVSAPYYFVSGLPSLLSSTRSTAYLLRLGHVLFASALFTVGVWNMSSRRPSPGSIALATVAFTPTVAFLLGTVSPSGIAIAAGFAIWTGGIALSQARDFTGRRVALMIASIVVFVVVRRDAIVWLLPILAVLALYVSSSLIRDSIRRPGARVVALLVAVGGLAVYMAGGDRLLQAIGRRPGSYDQASASEAFGLLPQYMTEMIGDLGWLDTKMPQPLLIAWFSLIAVAVLMCIGASRRDGTAVGIVLGVTLVIPYLFGMFYAVRYYQGRYGLPLAIGIPVIASAALTADHARDLLTARMARTVTWTVAVLSSVAFAVALRRFTVGHRAPWLNMFSDPAWSPPLPAVVLIIAYASLMSTMAIVLSGLIGRQENPTG